MTTEAQANPRGRTRALVNRLEIIEGDLLVARDGNHEVLEVSHSSDKRKTHLKIRADGQVFRQPVYGSRVVWRRDDA